MQRDQAIEICMWSLLERRYYGSSHTIDRIIAGFEKPIFKS